MNWKSIGPIQDILNEVMNCNVQRGQRHNERGELTVQWVGNIKNIFCITTWLNAGENVEYLKGTKGNPQEWLQFMARDFMSALFPR